MNGSASDKVGLWLVDRESLPPPTTHHRLTSSAFPALQTTKIQTQPPPPRLAFSSSSTAQPLGQYCDCMNVFFPCLPAPVIPACSRLSLKGSIHPNLAFCPSRSSYDPLSSSSAAGPLITTRSFAPLFNHSPPPLTFPPSWSINVVHLARTTIGSILPSRSSCGLFPALSPASLSPLLPLPRGSLVIVVEPLVPHRPTKCGRWTTLALFPSISSFITRCSCVRPVPLLSSTFGYQAHPDLCIIFDRALQDSSHLPSRSLSLLPDGIFCDPGRS